MSAGTDQGFLGRGWAFPVRLDQGGGIAMTGTGDEAIRQSMLTILGTARGERVMRPDFGCRIHDHVFGVRDAATAGAVVESVREALVEWEPRIDVLDVYAVADDTDPNRLLIEINYQVRSSNSRFNLVYPFYLA
ncbi:GPW/gp25 family protein [Sphaerisporangium corydalis]|uniref:GPW/gp25 family protein n=1 Tax=Sphaerisporangium corydalis TaxID=1441875 RepID=A0ABV9E7S6_9ACTN|nr:GPW/gp25 family protein [Sphaerisporangium corydalis]